MGRSLNDVIRWQSTLPLLDKIVSGIPVKRLGTPDDIASMVSWVASDESGFATGADFSVNGGLHMG